MCLLRPTASGTLPIHIASHRGSLEITSLLLGAGADVDAIDICSFQLIHLASGYIDRSAQITILISKGAKVEALNPLAPSWHTSPLQLACLTGQLANVCALLDPVAVKDTGRNFLDAPLGIAIRQGHVDIVKALLEQGFDPNHACQPKVTNLLANQGLRLGRPGRTPLSLLVRVLVIMASMSDRKMMKVIKSSSQYLCKSQSSINLDFRHYSNGERLVLELLGHGIDINATNDNGECPLYLVAMNCNEKLVHLPLLYRARYLSSAELFRLYKIVEVMEDGRPDMRDRIREMMSQLSARGGKKMKEERPKTGVISINE